MICYSKVGKRLHNHDIKFYKFLDSTEIEICTILDSTEIKFCMFLLSFGFKQYVCKCISFTSFWLVFEEDKPHIER